LRCILDTHFLLWVLLDIPRLDGFPRLNDYRPWGVSPVSFLEIQFLAEAGKLEVRSSALVDGIMNDARFVVDEVPLLVLIRNALLVDWTRDPFDRLLVAHSISRRSPLCTLDREIRARHGQVLAI
jgi:PIN domain nuclease of toxin-antitoxin system